MSAFFYISYFLYCLFVKSIIIIFRLELENFLKIFGLEWQVLIFLKFFFKVILYLKCSDTFILVRWGAEKTSPEKFTRVNEVWDMKDESVLNQIFDQHCSKFWFLLHQTENMLDQNHQSWLKEIVIKCFDQWKSILDHSVCML